MTSIVLRPGTPADAVMCGPICFHAFKAINDTHHFPPAFPCGGFLVPTRNGELFRWCLAQDFRLVHQMTLMTIGLYNEPQGAYLPSVLY